MTNGGNTKIYNQGEYSLQNYAGYSGNGRAGFCVVKGDTISVTLLRYKRAMA